MARNQTQVVEMDETQPIPSVSVVEKFSAMYESGQNMAEIFSAAHDALVVGHRTHKNVPFTYPVREGDTVDADQARFLSAAIVRGSLGNTEYKGVDEAAATKIKEVPVQYSLLEDAVDEIVKRELAAKGILPGTRDDRSHHVAAYVNAKPNAKLPSTRGLVREAIQNELRSMIPATKPVKGSGDAVVTPVANGSLLLDDDE